MIDKIFSVYDNKAKAYLPPFFMYNAELAKRTFGDCINSDKHAFHHHPDDYTLFLLGEFDNENAQINPTSTPKSLGNGVEFISYDTPTTSETEQEYDQVSNDPQLFRHAES